MKCFNLYILLLPNLELYFILYVLLVTNLWVIFYSIQAQLFITLISVHCLVLSYLDYVINHHTVATNPMEMNGYGVDKLGQCL